MNSEEISNRLAVLENQIKLLPEMDKKLDLIIQLDQKIGFQQREIEQLRTEMQVIRTQTEENRKELAEWEFLRKTSGWVIGIFSTLGMMIFGWWLNKH